jgi:hypothetical protein
MNMFKRAGLFNFFIFKNFDVDFYSICVNCLGKAYTCSKKTILNKTKHIFYVCIIFLCVNTCMILYDYIIVRLNKMMRSQCC